MSFFSTHSSFIRIFGSAVAIVVALFYIASNSIDTDGFRSPNNYVEYEDTIIPEIYSYTERSKEIQQSIEHVVFEKIPQCTQVNAVTVESLLELATSLAQTYGSLKAIQHTVDSYSGEYYVPLNSPLRMEYEYLRNLYNIEHIQKSPDFGFAGGTPPQFENSCWATISTSSTELRGQTNALTTKLTQRLKEVIHFIDPAIDIQTTLAAPPRLIEDLGTDQLQQERLPPLLEQIDEIEQGIRTQYEDGKLSAQLATQLFFIAEALRAQAHFSSIIISHPAGIENEFFGDPSQFEDRAIIDVTTTENKIYAKSLLERLAEQAAVSSEIRFTFTTAFATLASNQDAMFHRFLRLSSKFNAPLPPFLQDLLYGF